MTGKEPLVDKKTENSPLVGGQDAADEASASKERFYTILSIIGLITVNVIKVQLTAHLFESQNYPTAYSFWSAVCTIVLLIPIFLVKPSEFGRPSLAMLPIMTLVVLLTTLDMAFQNIALANASTALVMCIMATNPFWTVMLETALYCKRQHALVYLTVCFLVVGAVLVALGSPITRTSLYGTICACAAVLCSASKAVFTHSAFKKYKKVMGPMALLFWVDSSHQRSKLRMPCAPCRFSCHSIDCRWGSYDVADLHYVDRRQWRASRNVR